MPNSRTLAAVRRVRNPAPGVVETGFRCSDCGVHAVAIAPGQEAPKFDLFYVIRPIPMRCWCMSCWRSTFGVADE